MAKKQQPSKVDKKAIIDAFLEMARYKNIEKDLLQGIIQETLSLIVKKKFGMNSEFEIVVNMQKGDIEIYIVKQVVDVVEDPELEISLEEANLRSPDPLEIGDEFIEEITLENIADSFGRRLIVQISQILNNKINDFERSNIFQEYSEKVGQIIVGEIIQKRAAFMIVSKNGVEMKLLRDDQLPLDNLHYRKTKIIKAIIKEVKLTTSGSNPEILLTRKSNEFVKRLFEIEVPEISDGIVLIKAIAREPGERMKIALSSVVSRIDPIGTCVGLKGNRINSIIRELGNEIIDLIL